MHGLIMNLLVKRLAKAGFVAKIFSFPSVRLRPAENAKRLQKFLTTVDSHTVHFVCHSLGGLVVRHLLHTFPDQAEGRVVNLGTPHQPSGIAQQLCKILPGRLFLGESIDAGLLGGAPKWKRAKELGIIAGNLSLGPGLIIPGLPAPNDGTVAVEETRLAGMRDHIILPVTHMGLLLSRTVALQTIYFLNNGYFYR